MDFLAIRPTHKQANWQRNAHFIKIFWPHNPNMKVHSLMFLNEKTTIRS